MRFDAEVVRVSRFLQGIALLGGLLTMGDVCGQGATAGGLRLELDGKETSILSFSGGGFDVSFDLDEAVANPPSPVAASVPLHTLPVRSVARELRVREPSCADANADGALDISDAVTVLSHLFLGGPLPCEDPAGSGAGGDPAAPVCHIARFVLDLDPGGEAPTSLWWSLSGGENAMEVVLYTVSTDPEDTEEPGQAYFGDITLRGPIGGDRATVMEWLTEAAEGESSRRSSVLGNLDAGDPISIGPVDWIVTGYHLAAPAPDAVETGAPETLTLRAIPPGHAVPSTRVHRERVCLEREYREGVTDWEDWFEGAPNGAVLRKDATLRYVDGDGSELWRVRLLRAFPCRYDVINILSPGPSDPPREMLEMIVERYEYS